MIEDHWEVPYALLIAAKIHDQGWPLNLSKEGHYVFCLHSLNNAPTV